MTPWYKTESFRRLLAFVAGAIVYAFTVRTGVTPEEPPEWLKPIISEVQQTSAAVKRLEAK